MENPALADIESIVDERPDLSAEEMLTVEKAMPWIKSLLRPEVRLELEVDYARQRDEFRETLSQQSREQVQQLMDEWRKDQEPLSKEDIKVLLSQEYPEFSFRLKGLRDKQTHEITICELPQECEDKFLAVLQKHLVPVVQQFNASEFRATMRGNFTEQAIEFLKAIPAALVAVTEINAIVLNPWGDAPQFTAEWIRQNMSIRKQVMVLKAQAEANRYRDFFYEGSRIFR